MKNILLKSIFVIGLISNINAQSQSFPDDQQFESYQPQSKSLRLQQIKAKLNRLKNRRNQNKQTDTNFQDSRDFQDRRSEQTNSKRFSPNHRQPTQKQFQPSFQQQSSQRPQNTPRTRQSQHFSHEPQTAPQFQARDSRRAFSKRNERKQDAYDTALVRSCENAGKDLILRGSQGEKARRFYSQRCDQLISKIAIQHKLDNLLDLQGKYLSLQGRHPEANRFITLAYQQAPNSLNTNIALIKNLVSLGQAGMAEEMLLFYIGEKGVQNLDPREHNSLKSLHQQLKRMQ